MRVVVNLQEANEYPPVVTPWPGPIIVNESVPAGSIVTVLKVQQMSLNRFAQK